MKPETLEPGCESASTASAATCFCARISMISAATIRSGRVLRELVRKGRADEGRIRHLPRTRPSLIDGKPTLTKGIRELAAEAWPAWHRNRADPHGASVQRRAEPPRCRPAA